MDYQKFAPISEKKIIISKNLLEFNNSIWQIKNIVSASIIPIPIAFNVQQPQFNEAKPKFKYTKIIKSITIMIVGVMAANIFLLNWMIVVAGLTGAIMTWRYVTIFVNQRATWRQNKKKHEKKTEIWRAMKQDLPVVYAFFLEPSPNPSPICYTFDYLSLERIVTAIKQAMINPKKQKTVFFTLDVIDVKDETAINTLGSTIYDRKKKEITAPDESKNQS